MMESMKKEPEVGDVLVYLGHNKEEVGIIKDVGPDGLVRVQSGDYKRTVAPFDFICIFKGTTKTFEIARRFDR